MRKTLFTITVPYLFSPISAMGAESKPYLITLRCNIQETLQINQFKFIVFNNMFVKEGRLF